jgi:HPt (histidine-containing phosphotransfer) domain-containing protein
MHKGRRHHSVLRARNRQVTVMPSAAQANIGPKGVQPDAGNGADAGGLEREPGSVPPQGSAADQAHPPDAQGAPIDSQVLRASAMGDTALEREVLELFMHQSLLWTRAIRESQDAPARANAAHRLKGAALAVGARQLAERAQAIEDLSPTAQETDMLAAMAALHASVAETRAAIAALLSCSPLPA